jgi:hypothetical protein
VHAETFCMCAIAGYSTKGRRVFIPMTFITMSHYYYEQSSYVSILLNNKNRVIKPFNVKSIEQINKSTVYFYALCGNNGKSL